MWKKISPDINLFKFLGSFTHKRQLLVSSLEKSTKSIKAQTEMITKSIFFYIGKYQIHCQQPVDFVFYSRDQFQGIVAKTVEVTLCTSNIVPLCKFVGHSCQEKEPLLVSFGCQVYILPRFMLPEIYYAIKFSMLSCITYHIFKCNTFMYV